MKKIFYLASIAALALSSCTKDETTKANLGTVGGSKIVAAMEADDTRTQLDANGTYMWSAGDQLGVYGIGPHTLNNAAFVLDNSAANTAVGVFASQSTELEAGKPYLAIYPRLQKSIISEVGLKEVEVPNTNGLSKIKVYADDYKVGESAVNAPLNVEILDVQKYQNGSFYTNTAPAISSSFVVDADGADVKMQPVVDYLFVNIKSTEAIETLTLKLRKDNRTWYKLAGTTALRGYFYGKEYRYYAPEPTEGEDAITLETDESYKSIVCHEPNTYVFTIPAGILGTNANVEAFIYVNDETSARIGAVKSVPSTADKNYIVGNDDLNFRMVDTDGNGIPETKTWRADNQVDENGDLLYHKENTVFWMNPVDPQGKRTSFLYNPKNVAIIENEGQLLEYLYEYDNMQTKVDALICNEHEFDFSEAHMKEISSEMTKPTSEYYPYQKYINKYYKGEFPTITEYSNTFNGAGATIEGIVYALDNVRGIFGNITGKIENVTFDGIKTANGVEYKNTHLTKGLVLGTLTTDGAKTGSIENVTVNNPEAFAVLGAANTAAWEELTVTDVDQLNYVVANMTITKDLDLKADWATLKNVKTDVFGTLIAGDNSGDYHHVVTLPETADYSKLAAVVGAMQELEFIITNNLVMTTLGQGTPVLACVNDNAVVSVLLGDKTSVWTGDKFPENYWENPKVAVKQYKKATDEVNDWEVYDYYKLEYAEQLATGATEELNAVVMRDMDLSYAVNNWESVYVNHLEGNNKTISGLTMKIEGVQSFNDTSAAPVYANKLTNVNVNNVNLNIVTTSSTYVPQFIGGVANLINENPLVDNVKVNGLTIVGEGLGANNEQYNDMNPVNIGWLVGVATDATIENSQVLNVKTEIKGIAGLVGRLNVVSTANIQDSSATVTSMVQTALTTFKNFNHNSGVGASDSKWAKSNFAGTAVGYVDAQKANADVIVKFENVNKPVFGYRAADNNKIKVLYDADEVDVILTSNPYDGGNYPW